MKNLSKPAEMKTPVQEYTMAQWDSQLGKGWYLADSDGEWNYWRKMAENGYGDITAPQASLMKYRTIWELNTNQIQVLLGKDYVAQEWKNWEQERQQPLREYEEWLKNK